MKVIISALLLLGLCGCTDPFEYSAKASANRWGERVDSIFKDAARSCYVVASSHKPPYELKVESETISMADEPTCGGWVFKFIDPRNPNKDCGYILYAKDNVSDNGVWRVIFYAKNKQEFNVLCFKTHFSEFTLK